MAYRISATETGAINEPSANIFPAIVGSICSLALAAVRVP